VVRFRLDGNDTLVDVTLSVACVAFSKVTVTVTDAAAAYAALPAWLIVTTQLVGCDPETVPEASTEHPVEFVV
jgi:hypothetical protein